MTHWFFFGFIGFLFYSTVNYYSICFNLRKNERSMRKTGRSKREFEKSFERLRNIYIKMRGLRLTGKFKRGFQRIL